MSVFIDTSVLYAVTDKGEKRQAQAKMIMRRAAGEDPFTSDHVLVETWLLVRSRHGFDQAMRFWEGIRDTPIVIEPVTHGDLERAAAIGERWADQQFSLVDCSSIALMERTGCSRVATFDHDFAVYRYGPNRNRAFEILR